MDSWSDRPSRLPWEQRGTRRQAEDSRVTRRVSTRRSDPIEGIQERAQSGAIRVSNNQISTNTEAGNTG
ncbi:unnamed protein product, partial [Staurois parvus]